MNSPSQPVVLTIAGSDCSAGAGIQADLKTLQEIGVHGLSAVTCIVSETPSEVRHIETVSIESIRHQIQILLESYPVTAIKTGMLPSSECIITICELLKNYDIPIVTDPVMVASSGSSLMQKDAITAMAEQLIPLSTLVTPNLPEASALLGRDITSKNELEAAARDIAENFNTSCFLKGGHLPQGEDRLDVLCHEGTTYRFTHPDANIGEGIHGTGCTISSSIAGHIALGEPMEKAVENGITHVQRLITQSKIWHHKKQSIRCLGW